MRPHQTPPLNVYRKGGGLIINRGPLRHQRLQDELTISTVPICRRGPFVSMDDWVDGVTTVVAQMQVSIPQVQLCREGTFVVSYKETVTTTTDGFQHTHLTFVPLLLRPPRGES